MNIRPSATFILFTFNQEAFVREAVIGALSQDYSPLQIIISDDCSGDSTVEIIQSIVASYSGPHSVEIHVQERNPGVCAHVNYALARASGEMIVLAAGDDVSTPCRVSMVVSHFCGAGAGSYAAFSNARIIDHESTQLGFYFVKKPEFARDTEEFLSGLKCWGFGASMSIRRDIYERFGELDTAGFQEDGLIAFRAIILGGLEYIDKPLISYRIHGANTSQSLDVHRRMKFLLNRMPMVRGWLCDARKVLSVDSKVIIELQRRLMWLSFRHQFLVMKVFGYPYVFVRSFASRFVRTFTRRA